MENSKIADLQSQINQLQAELQHQKGMLWIIGEIIKNATNISSFQELMKIITDMLMGVMGVSACYLWIYNGTDDYTLHFRSIFLHNKYIEANTSHLPEFLEYPENLKPFLDVDIKTPLVKDAPLPGSRLAAPLYDFQRKAPLGFLIVEHKATGFFKDTTSALFETLAIFIGSNSLNSKLLETVSMEAEKDPLTNVFNRKFLARFLSEPYVQSAPLSLCMFDVDSFKLVNDLYGHEKGDDVLIAVAEAASNIVVPLGGKVIRYGGDEFVLLLNLPLSEATSVLNKIHTLIPTLPIMDSFATPITITMGVAEYPGNTTNISNLLALADSALLRGKSLGKNILEVG
ncbi:MAG TPA: diguanylate cyclase [Epulopiscium sp.]|nr:diguanylate cyclase [Candidatus Epulonipiscium sp.]